MVLQVGHADRVTALACSADQRLLFSASMDSTVRAWSLVDGALLHVWTGQTVGATAMGLSRGEKQLVIGGGRGTVNVADLRDFSLATTPRPPHVKRVEQITMLPDGNHFISLDRDGAAAGRPSGLAAQHHALARPGAHVRGRRLRRDPGRGHHRRGLHRRHRSGSTTPGGPRVRRWTPREGRPTALACSPDGRTLALGFETGKVVLRDVASHAETEHQMADRPDPQPGSASDRMDRGRSRPGPAACGPRGRPGRGEARRKMTDLLDRPAASVVFDAERPSSGGLHRGPGRRQGLAARGRWRRTD